MKRTISFLIAIIGSIALISPIYAADEADKQVGEADRQLQIEPSEYHDEQLQPRNSKIKTIPDMERQDVTVQEQPSQRVISMPVFDQKGEEIGKIQDISLDTRNGRIQYVAISLNSTGEGAEEDIAIPLEAVCFDQDKVVLTIDESKLEGAPKLREHGSDDDFQRDLQSHYGITSPWPGDRDGQKMTDVSPKNPINDKIKVDSKDNKLQNKDDSQLMNTDSRNLIVELRKMLLLCYPR
jgi:sporulation protein YlmC with PRC-barrel domain